MGSAMMKDHILRNRFVVVLIACLLFMGCNLINSSDNLKPGTFEITITGEIEKSFHGEAVYEILHGLDGSPTFWLKLKDVPIPREDYRIINITAGEKPGEGTYDIWDAEKREPETDQYYINYSDSDFKGKHGHYKSTGGKLNILSSRENQLLGSLNASAFETVHIGDGKFERVTVKITGKFHAQEGETGVIMN